jgi:outer membrane protein assembly factor BamB
MNRLILKTLAIFFISGLLSQNLFGQDGYPANDWPQWRGPDRSGTWFNGPRVDSLTSDLVTKVWDVPIGSGYNGPTLASGLVYVMDLKEGSERVLCLDARNGETEWVHSYPVAYSVGYPTGPRASVLIHSGKAYSWGTMGDLHCLDAKTGKVLWKINTVEKYQSRMPIWGMASNPILVSGLLVVQVGGENGSCLVAFHPDSGEEVWRALEDEASYSSPILISQAGKEVLVCWTAGKLAGLDPNTGNIYWSLDLPPLKMIMNISDPVYDAPYLFLSSFFDGSYLIELDQQTTSAKLVYHRHGSSERKTDALHCCISTPLAQEGFLYGVDSYGETRCLNLKTGDRIWEDLTLGPNERWANIHFVTQGDQVWGFNEIGELLLGKFTPEQYIDQGRVKVIDVFKISPNPRNGVNWAHPAFSGNRIFVRSDSRLICLQIESN